MHLNRKAAVLGSLIAVSVVAVLVIHQFAFAEPAPAFRFSTVERGDLQAVVSATGTLNAVTTVSVTHEPHVAVYATRIVQVQDGQNPARRAGD